MGIKFGNEWYPSGDYGTKFENELDAKAAQIEKIINNIKNERKNIDRNNKNSEVSSMTIELLDRMLSKFNTALITARTASNKIEKFNN